MTQSRGSTHGLGFSATKNFGGGPIEPEIALTR